MCVATFVSCSWKAFADDCKLYFRFPRDTCVPILLGMMQLQKYLSKVCSVAKSWNLKLNIAKRIVIRFGAYRTNDNMTFSYIIDGRILKFISCLKDLCVLGDSRLRFYEYVRSVVRRAEGLIGGLRSAVVATQLL